MSELSKQTGMPTSNPINAVLALVDEHAQDWSHAAVSGSGLLFDPSAPYHKKQALETTKKLKDAITELAQHNAALVELAKTATHDAVEEAKRLSGTSADETSTYWKHLPELATLLEFRDGGEKVQVIAGRGERFWELMLMVKESFTQKAGEK